ncbi:sucrose phosphorylase [Lachnospiraceae bacterium NK3A20]|nr:sucrose phosphorylase [Lachnospiraceae bacterium NK3A20]
MKKIENKCMLITYPDSLGKDLKELDRVLATYFQGAIGGLHVLPFYPSSGDRGFAVITYDKVEPAFGTWEDIDRLADKYYMMADFMLNHVSIRSEEFQDYMKKGDASPFKDMFIDWHKFWGGEPSEADYSLMLKRSMEPYKNFKREDGVTVRLWKTFFSEQIDVDPFSAVTQEYYDRNLKRIASHVPLIRFDAFAYCSKKAGTSCFFEEPEIWKILNIGMKPLRETGTEMLPEIHDHYQYQLKMAEKGYWVYDFALPMLLLHSLETGRTDRLKHWLDICPRKQFTTLDTHDGIGVVDVEGLMSDDEIDAVCARVEEYRGEAKRYDKFPSTVVVNGKKQRYQLSSTYFDACGSDERAYLLARAVQLFAPGIPQIYYVGLLAGSNDLEALRRGEERRSVNRHRYKEDELREACGREVVRNLLTLMRYRNESPAFDGEFAAEEGPEEGELTITRMDENVKAVLKANFKTKNFVITEEKGAGDKKVIFRQ